jgi:hypothetical protein
MNLRFLRTRDFLLLLLLCVGAACTKSTPSSTAENAKEAWRNQIEAVRRGESTDIVMELPVDDEDLAQLEGLEQLEVLKLQQGKITDAGLKTLAKLPRLRQLVLRSSPITDEGAALLAGFPTLRIVNLPQSEIGDAGLEMLASLPELELLRLGAKKPLSASALESLTRARNLRFLHFIDVPLTDDALRPIGEIASLESLYIDGASLSDDALSELIRRRPKLHLHLDQKHHDSDPKGRNHAH